MKLPNRISLTFIISIPVLFLLGLWLYITYLPAFMGADDFLGDFDPDDRYLRLPAGEASYDGAIVFTAVKRNIVEDVLPGDLALAENILGANFHPIIFVTGVQTAGWQGLPLPPPLKFSYNELILIIPFVRQKSGDLWHNYVVRMYLDSTLEVMGGILAWGYPKELAEFDTSTGVEIVRSAIEIYKSQITSSGGWKSYPDARIGFDNFKEMEEIFEMPVLGTALGGISYICSYFEWSFPYGKIREISQSYSIISEFVPGMSDWKGSHTNLTKGAWQVEDMRWKLDYPATTCKFKS